MSEETTGNLQKQAVGGFRIKSFSHKKCKDSEKVLLVLEANVEDVATGNSNLGDILGAFSNHSTSEMEIGLSVFTNTVK
jgi:hypothetical protein